MDSAQKLLTSGIAHMKDGQTAKGERLMEAALRDREARCTCGQTRPSTDAIQGRLAFFEFRGEGSRSATEQCQHCGYAVVAHGPDAPVWKSGKTAVETHGCPGFEPKGDWGYDTYYCGCRGWD
jgi:hypothetical protein